jgi:hypothetical protein
MAAKQQTKKPDLATRLRRAEKSAGSTKWALSGAGAKRNPPSPQRRRHLKEKLVRELALVRELRAKRDKAKAAAK